MSDKITQVLDLVSEMTVLECSELVKAFEEKFGVTAAAPMAVAAAGAPAAAGGGDAGGDEGPTEFDVILAEVGGEKIKVIKEVRAITGLGLKEAKEMVDNAPKPVKEGVDDEEAKKIKEQLEGVGAKVELKGK